MVEVQWEGTLVSICQSQVVLLIIYVGQIKSLKKMQVHINSFDECFASLASPCSFASGAWLSAATLA